MKRNQFVQTFVLLCKTIISISLLFLLIGSISSCIKDDEVQITKTPTVENISPSSGDKGTVVTITGNHFSTTIDDNTVKFGNIKAEITQASETQLTVIAPTGSGAVEVMIVVSEKEAVNKPTFTYVTTDSYTLALYTNELIPLIPYTPNNTYWMSMFAIDYQIYVIDREGDQDMWQYDLDGPDQFVKKASYPGEAANDPGLVGAANGKGYVGEYGQNGFWSYDPEDDNWSSLNDLTFYTGVANWSYYNDRYYTPSTEGVQEFNPENETWDKIDDVVGNRGSDNGCFSMGSNFYWYGGNSFKYSRYNFDNNQYDEFDFPEGFPTGTSATKNSFVIGNRAYLIYQNDLWVYDPATNVWTKEENVLQRSIFPRAVVVIDDAAYLIHNNQLFKFVVND